jgi:iron complex outermembrane receptor protein
MKGNLLVLRSITLLIAHCSLLICFAYPQSVPNAEEIIVLPEATIEEERDSPEIITQEEMERDNVTNLWEAVRYVPGVILSGGGRRNDSSFSVRGFGADSVPVYADGIELSNPYRGEADSARLLTGDLESVQIEKGYGTQLLGANNIGGAVLLRTAKPKEIFEFSVKNNFELDSIFKYSGFYHLIGFGTKQNLFYAKGVFQYRTVDHWRLPDSFQPFPENPQEKGDRLWSGSSDTKITLMAGWTPITGLDAWLTYIYENADKGTSPPETGTRDYEIWDWAFWRRQSVSLNGSYDFFPFSVSALFYFDKYDNRLDIYYKMRAYQLGIHDPHSDYDEYSLGGRLAAVWEINNWNMVSAALTYKKEDHIGLRGNITDDSVEKETHINEDTWSLGLEYVANPWSPLKLKAGFGYDSLLPIEYWNSENEYLQRLGADYFIVKTRDMFLYTWQAGAFYKLTPDHELRLTYARKNHFPTMAQRYSTRFGRNLPNPNLGPEIANHFEAGYRGHINATETIYININTAAYYSVLSGKIVDIEIPNPYNSGALVAYARNLDGVSFYGFELAPEIGIGKWFISALSFSVNNYKIDKTQDGVQVMSYYPLITFNAYIEYKPLEMLSIIPRVEYISARYAATDGLTILDAYCLANIKFSYRPDEHFTIDFSIDNIFDSLYEIRKNYPVSGRTYTISLTAKY